jgi:hypothetical protein
MEKVMFSLTLNKYGLRCELEAFGLKYDPVACFCDDDNTPSDSSIADV